LKRNKREEIISSIQKQKINTGSKNQNPENTEKGVRKNSKRKLEMSENNEINPNKKIKRDIKNDEKKREEKGGFLSYFVNPISTFFWTSVEDQETDGTTDGTLPVNNVEDQITSNDNNKAMPPPNSPYKKGPLFVVNEDSKTPPPLTWGTKAKSLNNYYYDESGKSNSVPNEDIRNWVKKENLTLALKAQRYIDPDQIFGDKPLTINISEVFGNLRSPQIQGRLTKEETVYYKKQMGYV